MKENYTKVLNNIEVGKGNFLLRVEKNNICFNPGQFFSLGLEDIIINREYSVASSSDKEFIDFYIREVEGGVLSNQLKKLKIGDEIKILGPYGEFYQQEFDRNKKYKFISTGTGIAPFISIINSNPDLDYELFHGVRKIDDIFLIDKFKNYKVYITQNTKEQIELIKKENDNFEIKLGRITSHKNDIFQEKDNSLYFLCGNSFMVSEVYDILLENKINTKNIFSEIFF